MTDRYRVTRKLATGGMAEVFLGTSTGSEGFEKPVAIKRMLPHLAQDERILKMFLAEAQVARHLQHQNIVSVIDVGRGPEGAFLVMEAVNGWDLRVLRRLVERQQRTFPAHLVTFIVSQVNAGLVHAYARRVDGKPFVTAHRDVADSNILVSKEGEVKVADFGIARLELVSGNTEPGSFKGRIAYAAPELLRGGKASPASDQFSLGILFHELLTNAHPWDSAENLADYVRRVQSAPPSLGANIPPELAVILRRMLSAAPEERLTPTDLSRALAGWLASSGVPAGAHELAEFVSSLHPPPAALELEPDPSLNASWTVSGFALDPVMPVMEDDWQPPPGPSLDPESGRVEQREITRNERPPAQRSRGAATSPARGAPSAKSGALPSVLEDNGPLELARDPAVRDSDAPNGGLTHGFGERQAPRSPMRFLVPLIVVAVLGGLGVLAWPQLRHRVQTQLRSGAPAATLMISSEPAGASVRIAGAEVGTTPLITDNIWPERDVEVELRHAGYKPWKGKFRGGTQEKVNVTLVRRGGGGR